MKLGLLLCDHVHADLIAEHGDYTDMFYQLLVTEQQRTQILSSPLEIINYAIISDIFPESAESCDAYLVTGSQHGVNDDYPWIKKLHRLLRMIYRKKKPLIGICFGHQLIASALGGCVERSKKGWGVGASGTQLLASHQWMEGQQRVTDISLLYSHQDQVVALPPNTRTLMRNKFCEYAMIECGGRFSGIQGHPEFSKAYSRELLQLRRDRLTDTVYQRAIKSLNMELDSQTITAWMLQYLETTSRHA